MKQYFKNLWLALTGRNPFQEELDEAKGQMKKAAENLSAMQDQMYSALEKWDGEAKLLAQSQKQVASLQQLTENLRERIADKDKMIAQLEEELNKK